MYRQVRSRWIHIADHCLNHMTPAKPWDMLNFHFSNLYMCYSLPPTHECHQWVSVVQAQCASCKYEYKSVDTFFFFNTFTNLINTWHRLTSEAQYQQNQNAYGGLQCFKHRCCCKEATKPKMWMLYTHVQPGRSI